MAVVADVVSPFGAAAAPVDSRVGVAGPAGVAGDGAGAFAGLALGVPDVPVAGAAATDSRFADGTSRDVVTFADGHRIQRTSATAATTATAIAARTQ